MSVCIVAPAFSYSWCKVAEQIANVLRSEGYNVEVIKLSHYLPKPRMYRNMIIVGDLIQAFRLLTPYAQYVIWYYDAPSICLNKRLVRYSFYGVESKFTFIPNSKWAKTVLESYGLKNITEPIHHGIDSNIWYPKASFKTYDFIYYSLYHERKGFDRLSQIASKLPNYKFRVISNTLLRDKVTFPQNVTVEYDLGTLTEYELFERVVNAKAYIQISYYEGFGITTLEAYCSGLNIIAPNIEPFNEYLPHDDVLWVEAYRDYSDVISYRVRGLTATYTLVMPKIKFNIEEFCQKCIEALKKPINIAKRQLYGKSYDYRLLYKRFREFLK